MGGLAVRTGVSGGGAVTRHGRHEEVASFRRVHLLGAHGLEVAGIDGIAQKAAHSEKGIFQIVFHLYSLQIGFMLA